MTELNTMAAFKLDIERGRVGVFRKKYWVFAFMRLEQRAKRKAGKRTCAFLKKVLLSGTGCELPAKAFRGEGIKFPHLNGIIVSDMASVGSNCTIYHQVTLGIVSENKDRGGLPLWVITLLSEQGRSFWDHVSLAMM